MALTIFESLDQGSPEWLQARAGIVTASVIGRLITTTGKVASNETSRALIDTLIAERITGRVEYTPPTRDMQRGTILEAESRRLYSEQYAPVTELGFGRLDGDGYTVGASPDGLVSDDGGWESKSPRAKTHLRTVLEDRVPPQYLAQVHTNLLVFDKAWWDFTSYVPGLPLYVKRVHRDARWDEAIITAATAYETTAREAVDKYTQATRDLPGTPYWDPFDEGEDIY